MLILAGNSAFVVPGMTSLVQVPILIVRHIIALWGTIRGTVWGTITQFTAKVDLIQIKVYCDFNELGGFHSGKDGSASRTRTCDKLINSQLLYQLSYCGIDHYG